MNDKTLSVFLSAINVVFHLLILAVIIFVPLGVITAVNTLFKTGIVYDWDTWLATAFIIALFYSISNKEVKLKFIPIDDQLINDVKDKE
jgi:hypothetical protein